MKREDQISRLVALKSESAPRSDVAKLRIEAEKIIGTNPLFNYHKVEEANEDWIKTHISTYGIFSLCEVVHQIPVWSHYADSHKGFAVEFSKSKLREFFIRNFYRTGVSITGYRVNYLTDYPVLIPGPNLGDRKDEALSNATLLSKSESWSYEEEYRYIFVKGPNRVVTIPKECITGIYLGLKMPQEDKEKILAIAKTRLPNAIIYEAKKEFGKFGLEFITVS